MFKLIALLLFNGIKGMMFTLCVCIFMAACFTNLDDKFLQYISGINENSFIKVLN